VRRDALLALVVLAAGWAATLWLSPFSSDSVNDLYVYRRFSESVLGGALPYRDVLLEYPPLAAPVILLPALFGTGVEVFRAVFAGWTLLLAASVVLLAGALAERTGGSRRTALFASAAMPLVCGAMVRTHFDLAPVALLLGALLALCTERPRLGAILLGAGALTKGFPLFAAGPALAWMYARYSARTALEAAGILAASVAIGCAFALAASPSGALESLHFQTDRPVQVESSPASVLHLLHAAGASDVAPVSSNRSDGLEHPASTALAAGFFGLMTLALVLLTRAVYVRPTTRSLILAALATAPAFAALGKVLSPQYLIWVVPLAALALAWREYPLGIAAVAAIVLTQIEFPTRYPAVVARDQNALMLVGARNLVLLGVVVLSLLALNRPEPAAARSRSPGHRRRPRSAPRSATDPLPTSRTSPG
jgi:uncharacterized membrane protein